MYKQNGKSRNLSFLRNFFNGKSTKKMTSEGGGFSPLTLYFPYCFLEILNCNREESLFTFSARFSCLSAA